MSARAYAHEPLLEQRHLQARSAPELADWLAWLDLGGAARTTRDGYEKTCAKLLIEFPDKAFDEFTDGDLMKVLRTYPEKSRRVRKAHLASWFKWGYKTRRIPANPVDLLPTIAQPRQPVIETFKPAEEAALMDLPSPDGHLMCLLLHAGLRKQEAIQMRAKRLSLDRRQVVVKEGAKGSKDRVVPMMPVLEHAMANLMLLEGLNPDDYLWYDKPGGSFAKRVRRSKPICDSAFHRWWVRCLDAAEVEYRKPHTTRHTFATRWRLQGLALDDIQQMLGHASVSTTSDLYVHTTVTEIGARMMELLGETV